MNFVKSDDVGLPKILERMSKEGEVFANVRYLTCNVGKNRARRRARNPERCFTNRYHDRKSFLRHAGAAAKAHKAQHREYLTTARNNIEDWELREWNAGLQRAGRE